MSFANSRLPFQMSSQFQASRRSPSHCLAVLSSAMMALLFVHEACGQNANTETVERTPDVTSAPSLGLKLEGESPVARAVLEQELSRAVGRPVTAEEHAEDGVITLSFEKDVATGALRVQVRYEPPPDQLVRVDVVTGDTAKIAPRVANLVQSLLRQDAGVTIVTPPPPPMPAGVRAADPSSQSQAECASTGRPTSESPHESATSAPKSRLTLRPPESWRIASGVRFSPFGSTSASGLDGHGRINGDVWILGGSVQAIAPSFGRLRLGIEGVLDRLDAEAPLGSGVTGSLRGLYVGISAMPSFNVLRSPNGLELNVSGHIGVVRTANLTLSGFTASEAESQWDIGYRAGLAVDVSYPFSEHFALNGAVGLDEVKVDVASFRRADPEDESAGLVRNDVRVWVKQPYLRLGASYRF